MLLLLILILAFDTVDHPILVSKLSEIGFSPAVLDWVDSYLYGRSQTTVVNGIKSAPGKLECGVPQGSILGPLFFILYVNKLPNILSNSSVYLYADDTAIAVKGRSNEQIMECLTSELGRASEWLNEHRLSLNLGKTKVMFFGTGAKLPSIDDIEVKLHDTRVAPVKAYKYLGVTLDSRLTFSDHIETIRKKSTPKIRTLCRISYYVSKKTILYLYKSLLLSQIEYGDIIYDSMSEKDSQYLQRLQNKCLKSILHLDPRTPTDELHKTAGIKQLKERRFEHVCLQVYKGVNAQSTPTVNELFATMSEEGSRTTRATARGDLVIPHSRLEIHRKSLKSRGPQYFNQLPMQTRQATTVSVFKRCMAKSGEIDTG